MKLGITDKIECMQCEAIFSIEHGRKSVITQHINTKRHGLLLNQKKVIQLQLILQKNLYNGYMNMHSVTLYSPYLQHTLFLKTKGKRKRYDADIVDIR